MTKNTFPFFILFFFIFLNVNSQNSNMTFWDDVQFGGSFNVGLGSNFTTIAISPSAIYNFSDEFSAGLSATYLYSKNKFYDTSTNVYGASVISLYNVIEELQLSAEFEELNINFKNDIDKNSYWNPALYIGAAYRTGSISFGIRYDLLYKEDKSIYSSAITPIFRVYF